MKSTLLLLFLFLLANPYDGFGQNKKTTKLIQLAQNQLIAGKIEEGIKTLDQAVSNESDLASTYHLRGSFKLEINDLEGALIDYTKAINLDPNFHDAYKDRGIIRTQLEENGGAMVDFNKAIELEPKRSDNRNNRGFLYIQMGEFEKAIPDLKMAIQLNIHNLKAHENLINALLEVGKGVEAWDAANNFVMTNPDEVSGYLERGRTSFLLGRCFSAIQDYDKAIQIAPHDYRAYVERGRLRDDCVEDESGAILDFDEAIRLNPDFLYAYYSRTSPNYDLENYDAVIRDCDFYIANDSTFAPIFAMRGVVKSIQEDYEGAMLDLKKAIVLEPDDSYAYIQLSVSLINQEKFVESSQVLNDYLKKYPKDYDVLYQRASAYYQGGDFAQSLEDLNGLIQQDSLEATAYYLRALVKEGLGDMEGACEDMSIPAKGQLGDSKEFVLTKCGEYIDSAEVQSLEHFYNAGGFVMMGDHFSALQELEKAIALDPNNKSFYYERGYAKRKLFKPDEAIIDFNKAIALDSSFADPFGAIGYIELKRENYDVGRKYLKMAMERNPVDPTYYNNLGNLELRADNLKDAIPYFEKAIELAPDRLNSYLSLGECYARLGQMNKTCEILEKAEKNGHQYAGILRKESCN